MRGVFAPIVITLVACGSRTALESTVTESLDGAADATATDAGRRDAATDAARSDGATTEDAGPPEFFFSAGAKCIDHVSPADEGIFPDGQPDACFKATLPGALDGLILVTVDQQGNTCCGQEWDTLVENDPLPQSQFGLQFSEGAQTWVLGLATCDKGCPLVNDAKGRISLGGTRASSKGMILYASDSGYFNHGQGFRMYGHTTSGWIASAVVTWP